MRRQIDTESIVEVASALGELNEKTVFVGGAVVSIYVNDPAADEGQQKILILLLKLSRLGNLKY